MIFTVTFNPAIDCVAHLTAPLVPGGINRCTEEFQFGGKGINVSVMLHTLGCESTALGFVAGATGAWLEQDLAEQGVRCDFIRLPAGMTRINMKIKADVETEMNGFGPEITRKAMERLTEQLEELGAGDTLVLAGSIPAGLPDTTYERILAQLSGRGIRTVVDAEGGLLERVLPYRPFLIKPNHIELGEICGCDLSAKTPDIEQRIAECAAKLQARGARNVLVSRAGDGAMLLDETGALHTLPAPKGKVINSVGAGDSMVAGFLAACAAQKPYADALRLGAAAGSATAFTLGLGTKEAIDALLEQMKAEEK